MCQNKNSTGREFKTNVGAAFVVYKNNSLVYCVYHLVERNLIFDPELYTNLQTLLWA